MGEVGEEAKLFCSETCFSHYRNSAAPTRPRVAKVVFAYHFIENLAANKICWQYQHNYNLFYNLTMNLLLSHN